MPDLPASYWAATAIPAPDCPELWESVRADVCIIGGGFMGLSTALHLAEAGTSVVVLEAAEPGWGASGRNGGQIIPGWKVEHSKLVQQHGATCAERITDWAGGFVDLVLDVVKTHAIDCDASKSGWVQAAHSYALLEVHKQRAAYLQARGAPVEVVEKEGAARLLGTDWYKGAFVDRRGGRLHPLSYARGLAHAAIGAGARIFGATPATSLHRRAAGWEVRTGQGRVVADQVILCTNAYTDGMGHRPLVPGLATSIVAFDSYMLATAPLTANLRATILPGGEVVSDNKKLMHHFRLEQDGSFIFGGRGAMRDSAGAESYAPLVTKLREIYPRLADVPISYRWSGRVALTSDGGPHLHRLGNGLTVALGCNGRGVGMCTAVGKLLASLVHGMPETESPMPVSPIRAIPFHALRLVGVQSAVWFKAWQDRRDYGRAAVH